MIQQGRDGAENVRWQSQRWFVRRGEAEIVSLVVSVVGGIAADGVCCTYDGIAWPVCQCLIEADHWGRLVSQRLCLVGVVPS